MLQSFQGKSPRIAESAYIHESAVIIGDVEIGENCSVWPGVVIRADFGPTRIGKNTNIQDNAVVHCNEVDIGDDVTIGHGAVVHCRRVGNNSLIGINAALLDDAEVGEFCLVAAGAVVTDRTIIPPYSLVTGVPGKAQPLRQKWIDHLKTASQIYTDLIKRCRT